MGRLISLAELDPDPSWYFTDAYYGSTGNGSAWRYEWPSKDYPYMLSIHSEDINPEKVRIREWVESTADTVIVDYFENNYRIFYGKQQDWDKSYHVSNSWRRFHFRNKDTATAFALVFSDIIKPITDYNPKYPEHKEIIERAQNEKACYYSEDC